MPEGNVSRRGFFGASTAGAATLAAIAAPTYSAAAAAGIKPGDLPDLAIKQVKVYVVVAGSGGNQGESQIASVVTNSGIEGNYTLGNRYWHPNWSNLGWLEYSKRLLPGKAVNLPVYRIVGAYRDKVRAYASSQHHDKLEDFVTEVQTIKGQGFTAYKIHPPSPNGGHDYKLDMEVAKAVRKEAGDEFTLLMDPVGVYTREEAIKVGRLLQDLNYVAYEDPIPTDDIDGLVELCRSLDIPIHIGEFIFSPYNFAEYIRRGAVDVVRFIVDNVGGITGGMKIARLAECFGMECAPHNWGEAFDHAVHFHCELAMPNNKWFEMTVPQGSSDRPYIKDHFRVAKDGCVHAPVKPGLGYEIDRDVLDRMIKRVET